MSRFALMRGNEVHEIVVLDEDASVGDRFHPDLVARMRPAGAEVQEGWVWDGSAWSPPPQPAPPVPDVVALWQFRCELQARGLWEAVRAAIAAMPTQQRADVEEWLEYGVEANRNSPLLIAMAGALGLADSLDEMFRAAAARAL
jgi:hypothetical protein